MLRNTSLIRLFQANNQSKRFVASQLTAASSTYKHQKNPNTPLIKFSTHAKKASCPFAANKETLDLASKMSLHGLIKTSISSEKMTDDLTDILIQHQDDEIFLACINIIIKKYEDLYESTSKAKDRDRIWLASEIAKSIRHFENNYKSVKHLENFLYDFKSLPASLNYHFSLVHGFNHDTNFITKFIGQFYIDEAITHACTSCDRISITTLIKEKFTSGRP